ncbi:NAD(P)H-dependent oxidoreductase subunit E [Candidatus Bathyarchaeota archaeon]|nr:NAD(P)H-dependent oxidoreductase subunit E [Candidatus Bathyarchaeota archaeon]
MENQVDPQYSDIIDEVLNKFKPFNKNLLISILQEIQYTIGYLPKAVLEELSDKTNIPLSQIYGVATFYHQFRLNLKGKHLITICLGTACHVQGSNNLLNYIQDVLQLNDNLDTTEDRFFTLNQVRCLGTCGLAPIIKIDNDFYGNVSPTDLKKIFEKYRSIDV